jgi:hypothetical protein
VKEPRLRGVYAQVEALGGTAGGPDALGARAFPREGPIAPDDDRAPTPGSPLVHPAGMPTAPDGPGLDRPDVARTPPGTPPETHSEEDQDP